MMDSCLRLKISSKYLYGHQKFCIESDKRKEHIHLDCCLEGNQLEVRSDRMVSHEDIFYLLLTHVYLYSWNKYKYKRQKRSKRQGLEYMEYLASRGEVIYRMGTILLGSERVAYCLLYLPQKETLYFEQQQSLITHDFTFMEYLEMSIIDVKAKTVYSTNDTTKILNYVQKPIETPKILSKCKER